MKSECIKDSAFACPPPLGAVPPSGCKKTFVEDVNGIISCNEHSDCPQSYDFWRNTAEGSHCEGFLAGDKKTTPTHTLGFCRENKCSFESSDCGNWEFCIDVNNYHGIVNFYQCNSKRDCYIRRFSNEFNKKLNMQCVNNRCISKEKLDCRDEYISLTTGKLEDCVLMTPEPYRLQGCSPTDDGNHGGTTVSFSRTPNYFTPVVGTSKGKSNCLNCRPLTCPPALPCKLGNKCNKATCLYGRCWCPRKKIPK